MSTNVYYRVAAANVVNGESQFTTQRREAIALLKQAEPNYYNIKRKTEQEALQDLKRYEEKVPELKGRLAVYEYSDIPSFF